MDVGGEEVVDEENSNPVENQQIRLGGLESGARPRDTMRDAFLPRMFR